MKSINLSQFKKFNRKLYWNLLFLLVLYIASAFITQLVLKHNPQYNNSYLNNFYKNLSLKTTAINFSSKNCLKISAFLFLNNLKANISATIIGIVPFVFLSTLVPVVNGIILGLVILEAEKYKVNILYFLLLGILPHGIFEISATLYAASIGIYITKNIMSFIKRKEHYVPLKKLIPEILKAYTLIIIPLLSIAALIEASIVIAILVCPKTAIHNCLN